MEKFYNKLVEMDQHFISEEFKVKLLGGQFASKYERQPIVRRPERDEEDEVPDGGVKYQPYRPPYTKIKLMLWSSGSELPCSVSLTRRTMGPGRRSS